MSRAMRILGPLIIAYAAVTGVGFVSLLIIGVFCGWLAAEDR